MLLGARMRAVTRATIADTRTKVLGALAVIALLYLFKERAIRKQIVERMSLDKGATVPASLVLMSVVKDAERVGDYCKNLLEVDQMLQKPVNASQYCTIAEHGHHIQTPY